MSEEYEWNGLQVRRSKRGWLYLSEEDRDTATLWLPLTTHTVQEAVAAELDRLYPAPRTVTLDNGDVWAKEDDQWEWSAGISAGRGISACDDLDAALDTLDRVLNGDDR